MALSADADFSAIRMPSSVVFLLFVAIITTGITCATIFGPMALPPGSKLQCEVVPR